MAGSSNAPNSLSRFNRAAMGPAGPQGPKGPGTDTSKNWPGYNGPGQPTVQKYGVGMTPGSAWDSSGMPAVTGNSAAQQNAQYPIDSGSNVNVPLGGPGHAVLQGAPTTPDAGQQFLQSPFAHFLAGLSDGSQGQVNLGQFQASLGQARGDIQKQLANALGDIQNSQNAANQAIGTLPGQINSAWGQVNGTTNNALSALQAAQQKSGVQSLMPASAYMAPERAAVAGEQTADLQNVPLLQAGANQSADRNRALANQAALNDLGQLDQQGAQGSLQAAMANAAQKGQSPRDQFLSQYFLNQQQNQAGINSQNNAAKLNGGASSPSAGGVYQNTGLTQQQLTQTLHSQDYKNSVAALQNGTWTRHDLQRLQQKYPELLAVLSAGVGSQYPEFLAPKK